MSLPKMPSKHQHLDDFLSHCHKRRYPARSTLIYAGEESDTLYYLIKGSVSVIIEDDDGHVIADMSLPIQLLAIFGRNF